MPHSRVGQEPDLPQRPSLHHSSTVARFGGSNQRLSSRTSVSINTERKERFTWRHGAKQAEQIQKSAATIAKTLKDKEAAARYVLHPEKNRWIGRWDGVTSLALVYTATLTPFETAFIPPVVGAAAWREPWFIVNRMLDVIFFCDLIIQFFVAYQTGSQCGGRSWVLDRQLVRWHYLKTWFPLDALTVFLPGGFDLFLASLDPTVAAGGGEADSIVSSRMAERASILRVMRIMRLVKLVRLIRASRVLERQEAKISISFGTLTIIKIILSVCIAIHW